jgi:tetratricopeptide (TPR) repeat protein
MISKYISHQTSPEVPPLSVAASLAQFRLMRPHSICWLLVCWSCLVGLSGFSTPLQAADPFYIELREAGFRAYDRGDYASAQRDLRIASFGLLDEPHLLAEALTYLALSQAESADSDGFTNTAHRIVEIEDRFRAFTGASLPTDLRRQFTSELIDRVDEGTLLRSPTFAPLVQQRSQNRFESLTPDEKRGELTRRLTAEPNNLDLLNSLVALEMAAGRTIEALNWLDRMVGVNPSAPEVRCRRSNLAAQVGDCRTALADRFHCATPPARLEPAIALVECMIAQENWDSAATMVRNLAPNLQADPKLAKLAQRIRKNQSPAGPSESSESSQSSDAADSLEHSKPSTEANQSTRAADRQPSPPSYQDDLALLKQRLHDLSPSDDPAEVMVLAHSISNRHLGSEDIQILAGETAYRLSQWESAIRFFDRAGSLSRKQPDLLFYLAVSLFETGQLEAARKSLEKSLPKLQRTPFVESFIAKINLQTSSAH